MELLAERSHTVGEIVAVLSVSQPAVSKQLRRLRDAGWVAVSRAGRHRRYQATATGLPQADSWSRDLMPAATTRPQHGGVVTTAMPLDAPLPVPSVIDATVWRAPGGPPRLRDSLAQRALRQLRDRICSRELQPGALLSVKRLAAELGMSRTPVTEALKLLGMEGLVEVLPQVGFRVTGVTLSDVEEIFRLRALLEPYAVEQAMRNVSDHQLEELWGVCQMPDAEIVLGGDATLSVTPPDFLVAVEAHDRFHVRIAELAGNRRLAHLVRDLLRQSRRIRITDASLASPLRRTSPRRHILIAEAMVARDAPGAVRLMAAHLAEVQEMTLRAVGRWPMSSTDRV